MGMTNRCLGDFELVERIGVGGMAQVWRGRHLHDGFEAALKFVTGDVAASAKDAFHSEIRKVAGMRHPGVVRIWDFGYASEETELGDGARLARDSPWIAMELAAADLDTLRITNWPALQRTLLSLLDGLGYAHARGLLHCDLKPANVLVFRSEGDEFSAKLSDFGIARLLQESPQFRAGDDEGRLSGTPSFMAPEQWVGAWRDFAPATDLYGFGCMAYALASGQPPFIHGNAVRLAMAHRSEPPPVLRSRFDCPLGFDAWLERLLAKQPLERFQRAAHAAEALGQLPGVLDGESVDIVPAISPHAATLTMDMDLAITARFHGIGQRASDAPLGAADERPIRVPEISSFSTPAAEWQRRLYATRNAPPPVALIRYSELPVVGRDTDKEAIWAELTTALASGTSRLVLFEAEDGSALPALQRWLCLHAHEEAVGQPFWIELGDADDASRAVARSIERSVGAVGLVEPNETLARIRQLRFDEADAEALAAVIRPRSGPLTNEQLDLLVRAFDCLSRPFLPVFAIRRTPGISSFVAALGRADGPRLITVLGSSEELDPLRDDAHRVCGERHWSDEDFRAAVRSLLVMEPDVAGQLYQACEGHLDRSPSCMRRWASEGVVRWSGSRWTWVGRGLD